MTNSQRHHIICELTWGCTPTDTQWAKNSQLYKETETKLMLQGIISKQSKQKLIMKEISKEELIANRSSAYKYLFD